jgi:hypothetical protein
MDESPVLPPAAAAFGISFDGRAYHYREYSYDRLADALGYARLDRTRPGFREDATPRRWKQWVGPTPEEQLHMAAHGIVHEHGHYYYGPYRYDLLSAALDYAKHEPGLSRPGSRQGG